ncbi:MULTISPECIES: hypothetical protein [Streptosporangium]|uniref:Glucan phosphoethanolaminetransferase (Alkaline phosphatase superfamily) n=1 Tax=Streptosporangium brasiliense TaxID=47480 RepID=A0ABT9QY26_9ACTN|nr:hypothetical protein [Streptosporangium brasiliense]MDP9861896.1 glucan phosphoethanolaminetransferase (alkaline phosphatase superfamily) [Streptosporangium brasiliense]
MSDNWTAVAMAFVALFLVGGIISFFKQGLKVGALLLAVLAALATTAAVLWW